MAKKVKLKLKKYLDEHEISRYALAKKTNIDYQTINNYYKDKLKRYDSYLLAEICAALECNINDIIELSEENLEQDNN